MVPPPQEGRRASDTQLTRPAFERRRFKRALDFRPKAKWLAFALPIVALLVVVGVGLGFWLRGKSVNTVQSHMGSASSRIQGEAPKDMQSHAAKAESPNNALTVDMLPLVTPTGHAGGSPQQPVKSGAEPLNPEGQHRVEPRPNRPLSPPRPSKISRDYGI